LLIVVIAIAGLLFGQEAAQGRIVTELRGLVGGPVAAAIERMVEESRRTGAGAATGIAVATLLLGASGVFNELRGALNAMWNVPPGPSAGWIAVIRSRLLSFAMVLAVGFLLVVSLAFNAIIAAWDGALSRYLPDHAALLHHLNTAASFVVITALFALIFRFLPDVRMPWREVLLGALLTSALFNGGKYAIGLYLGKSSLGSVYGAAGSVVILVIWVYYAAQIFLFGAELTQVLHRSFTRPPEGARDSGTTEKAGGA
jgi:membrane protein